MIRVLLPRALRELAGIDGEIALAVPGEPGTAAVLDMLEARHPALRGAIRDPVSGRRRPLLRYFADGRDVSLLDDQAPLPRPVLEGRAPLLVIAAIAGG
ncbi:MAG: MoaD/ThiS family protein [Gammaproteobacteria bacterium]|nr:MoaD/ThiS family protein [Gammaproteobacteria bacterium]